MAAPLADRMRPATLEDMVGQQHLLGPNGLLRRIAQSGSLPNLIFYGPSGVVFTKLYRFKGDPEFTNIRAFPAAEKEFNAMLKNVETMEYICQLWEEVKTSDLEVDFYHAGQLYGRILFTNGSVSFEAHTGNGWKTSDAPEKLINYSKWFKERNL